MEKSGDYRSTFFGRNLMVLSRVLFIRILLVPHHSHRINLSFDALLCLISTLGDPPPLSLQPTFNVPPSFFREEAI